MLEPKCLPSLIAAAWVAALTLLPASAATPVYKCVTNGSVTYQRDPCPSSEARKAQTVERLNIEQKKRNEASGVGRSREAVQRMPKAGDSPDTSSAESPGTSPPSGKQSPLATSYRCDGRRYCSQMTSCAESKFFLANCPGVKMDGDGDGTPCEEQWCGR